MKFDTTQFPDLIAALRDFDFVDKLSWIRDPEVDGVFLFKGEFDDGRYCLFIWSNPRKMLIEEPAEIADYNFRSIAQVYAKYPGLRPNK